VTVQVRHPRKDESAAVTAVLNEHSRRLHGTDDLTVAELEEDWFGPEIEFPDDVFLAELSGRIIGYADVIAYGDTSWLDVRCIDPRAYDPLFSALVPRAREKGHEHLRGWAPDKDDVLHEAYARAGFRPFRHSFRMEIELAGDLPEPSWPEGFVVRVYREGDERRVHNAQEDSFADTWGYAPQPFEKWAHYMMGSGFQPEHWFLVETGDELAAIALCRVPPTEPDIGWVNILGVPPAFRRRGLAIALLQHVFRHFAAVGKERVGLGVDAENPTGAVRLYERAGMHVARRDVRYELAHGQG
jgi:mycothiol synthase